MEIKNKGYKMFFSYTKQNRVLSVAAATLLSIGIVGCGGGGGSNSSTTPSTTATKIGQFIDAPVEGLHYQTATQDGYTDAQGHFKYKDGESVEFQLGTLSLGNSEAKDVLTPYDITDDNNTAINIALVLQNFDANQSNKDTIDLSNLRNYNFSENDINLSASHNDLKNELANLIASSSLPGLVDMNYQPIDETTAKNNMDNWNTYTQEGTASSTTSSPAIDNNGATDKNLEEQFTHFEIQPAIDENKTTTGTASSSATSSSATTGTATATTGDNNTLPDLSGYTTIGIYKHVDSTKLNAQFENGATAETLYHQNTDENISCESLGFTHLLGTTPMDDGVHKTYMDGQRMCMEIDYNQNSFFYGSDTEISYQN